MKHLFGLVIIFSLLFVSCANTIGTDSETNEPGTPTDPKDPNTPKDPENPTDPVDPSKTCTLINEIKCKDTKERVKCENGIWQDHEICASACLDGECVDVNYFISCERPLSIIVDSVVSGTTATSSNTINWGSTCAPAVPNAGSEAIYLLQTTKTGLYKITVDASSEQNGFSAYIQRECGKSTTVYKDSCMYSYKADTISKTVLMNPGKHYIIVDNPNAGKTSNFKLSLTSAVEPLSVCLQNTKPAKGELLDLSAPVTLTGSTSEGYSHLTWNAFAGCTRPGSGGNEIVYTFRVEKEQQLTANLNISPLADSTTPLADLLGAMYVLSCGSDTAPMKMCTNAVTADGKMSLSMPLEPGNYSLVIDNANPRGAKDFNFTLSLNLK